MTKEQESNIRIKNMKILGVFFCVGGIFFSIITSFYYKRSFTTYGYITSLYGIYLLNRSREMSKIGKNEVFLVTTFYILASSMELIISMLFS
jgi:hypothetical protein